jgi:hypothetical membrane protein
MAGSAAKAGAALFLGTVQYGIGLILAEAFYPGYNVSTNAVSDLGATCSTPCVIYYPTATIFDTSIVILGVAILVTAYFSRKAFKSTLFSVIVALGGIGAIGVGTFNETTGIFHSIFSLIVFLFAGISALMASRYVKPPMSIFSIVLGLLTLIALALYVPKIYLGLGQGGMERMIVYPVLLWAIGYGGHLMSLPDRE